MRRLKLIALGYLLTLAIATPLVLAQDNQPRPEGQPAFQTLDIYVDPRGVPLGAYQFELREARGRMTVVGLENGEHPAFAQPPFYDASAVAAGRADRVIAAAYSLRPPEQLPTQRTRVCTVHVQLTGPGEPDFVLDLVAAGNAEGRPIPATIEFE
jgi:hypothetical protein